MRCLTTLFLEVLRACTPDLSWLSAELRCTPWVLVKRLTLFVARVFDTAEDFRFPRVAATLIEAVQGPPSWSYMNCPKLVHCAPPRPTQTFLGSALTCGPRPMKVPICTALEGLGTMDNFGTIDGLHAPICPLSSRTTRLWAYHVGICGGC